MAESQVKIGKKRVQKKGPHKLKTAGKRQHKIAAYYLGVWQKHKIRRILDTQGLNAARSWADKHGYLPTLTTILNKRRAA